MCIRDRTGRKVNLRENFKLLAQKKLSRFERIFDEDAEASVMVTVERKVQTVEITIRQKGMIYRAEASSPEMNDALDQVVSCLLYTSIYQLNSWGWD